MKPSEILRAAKAKIENPLCWTQDCFGKDSEGEEVTNTWEERRYPVVCFCSLGALESVVKCHSWETKGFVEPLTMAVKELSKYHSIEGYNDSHSHSEVMAMWGRAIELAEAEENCGSVS